MKQSESQLPALQTLPEAQPDPFARFVHAEVLVPGWQLAHAFIGSVVPDGYVTVAMSHWIPHFPLAQICPLPHPVPFETFVQADVLVAGWQLWQALSGFGSFVVYWTPPM
jgi:hypothetical protein